MEDSKSIALERTQAFFELFRRVQTQDHAEDVLREQAHAFSFACIAGFHGARERNIGTPAKERELTRILNAARKLFYALEESHTLTRLALVKRLEMPNDFEVARKAAQKIYFAAGWGLNDNSASEPASTDLGPPTRSDLANVTTLAAGMFRFLTGEEPTVPYRAIARGYSNDSLGAYGPFIDFLGAVFKLLALIGASPEAQARAYLQNAKSDETPKGH